MTTVINMLGGPGCGKSTTAAGLYYQMKLKHINVELVREYVKMLAWQGFKIGQFDQVNIFGEQCKLEHSLYGKVNFIVTDSPVILAPIYEYIYHDESIIEDAAFRFMKKAESLDVKHINVLLERTKSYDSNGRYQTLEEAIEIDLTIREYLDTHNMKYHVISGPDETRPKQLLDLLINV